MKTGRYDVTIEPNKAGTCQLIEVTMRDCGCTAWTEARDSTALAVAISQIEYLAARIASSHDCATS